MKVVKAAQPVLLIGNAKVLSCLLVCLSNGCSDNSDRLSRSPIQHAGVGCIANLTSRVAVSSACHFILASISDGFTSSQCVEELQSWSVPPIHKAYVISSSSRVSFHQKQQTEGAAYLLVHPEQSLSIVSWTCQGCNRVPVSGKSSRGQPCDTSSFVVSGPSSSITAQQRLTHPRLIFDPAAAFRSAALSQRRITVY